MYAIFCEDKKIKFINYWNLRLEKINKNIFTLRTKYMQPMENN